MSWTRFRIYKAGRSTDTKHYKVTDEMNNPLYTAYRDRFTNSRGDTLAILTNFKRVHLPNKPFFPDGVMEWAEQRYEWVENTNGRSEIARVQKKQPWGDLPVGDIVIQDHSNNMSERIIATGLAVLINLNYEQYRYLVRVGGPQSRSLVSGAPRFGSLVSRSPQSGPLVSRSRHHMSLVPSAPQPRPNRQQGPVDTNRPRDVQYIEEERIRRRWVNLKH